ncbi:hypothetical protein B5C26_23600 [Photorhabdus luminescens]|uniref:hypothetical protein n=1 Tax=Photorhabdus luminescens TaxID=29488 RepID=UPI000B767C33|nr:hypothetical protein [Photorhabdus luminescens]OWO78680.1 hypothetical protein B5C26_23600 [Photorhabdus luminescens]
MMINDECNCIAGMIGNRRISVSKWKEEVRKFDKVIDKFNIETKRKEVPHPGFVFYFRYCPDCGMRINLNSEV